MLEVCQIMTEEIDEESFHNGFADRDLPPHMSHNTQQGPSGNPSYPRERHPTVSYTQRERQYLAGAKSFNRVMLQEMPETGGGDPSDNSDEDDEGDEHSR
jgi:hypothetical protein